MLGAGVVAGVALSGGGAVAAPVASPTAPADPADPADPFEGRGPGHEHTEVTGDELADVTAAVTAHDAAVEVEAVRQDPDGSYDALGTKDGEPVFLEVGADLATVTEREGGPGRGGPCGPGGPGGPAAPGEGATTTPSGLRVA